MGGEFDFLKSQIPTNSPSKPRRGVVGLNIDRCIIIRIFFFQSEREEIAEREKPEFLKVSLKRTFS